MGRPREHDERTAASLLDAAERIIDSTGPDTLSVRGVAEDVGTTTRAVYSLFGSKDGLLTALSVRAFEMLGTSIRALPTTKDPAADLVEAGVVVFRRFAIGHPSLFKIAVQRTIGSPALAEEITNAQTAAFEGLQMNVARLKDVGLLGGRTVRDAATQFHALCEGLAALELRGQIAPNGAERLWRDALGALVAGLSIPTQRRPRRTTTSAKRTT
jgi:AcrR family transcriptional regulator